MSSHPVSMALSTTGSTLPPTLPLPPPNLQEATKKSTEAWQKDLELLFHHARDRFPDVVWEFVDEEEEEAQNVVEQVWGHKAIVYARAPPSFQNRYFSVRPNGATSPLPYSPYPGESALSLGLDGPATTLSTTLALTRTPSPFRSSSPNGSTTSAPAPSTLLRLTTSINPALFANELEYLYTGKGFGEAFEFLFEEAKERGNGEDDDPELLRVDKLRKDLVFMWRSRLYSDVRISLSGNFGGNHENTTAIFSSHRFILVSRSSYFSDQLTWPHKAIGNGSNEPPTLTLPSPPFTPASLHFTLGFLYTGTLIFSHRTYDLSTAFAIMKASLYLSIPTLHDEIQARIVQEMMHGLFHAFVTFNEYESLTGGKWGTGGCRCRQCARRAPRVLEFALEEDIKNPLLERGARRALVGLFGEGWCTQEFATLPPKLRESILKGLAKRTTPTNVFPLLFAAEHALQKLQTVIDAWADVVREAIGQAKRGVEECLCREADKCFGMEEGEWMDIMKGDGGRFEDAERVEWVMGAVLRGVKEAWAPSVYQTLVSSILLRPHPTDVTDTLLSATSHVRVQVEQTRIELLKWIAKRWITIRQEKGFDPLEGWALKEISDHIEVPIDDLLSPPNYSSPKSSHHTRPRPSNNNSNNNNPLLRPISQHPHTSKIDAESDAGSSMRVSVLSRSLAGTTPARGTRSGAGGDTASLRSGARSTHSLASSFVSSSTVSTARHPGVSLNHHHHHHREHGAGHGHSNGQQMSPAKQLAADVRAGRTTSLSSKERPDSKLLPSSTSIRGPSIIEPGDGDLYEGDETGEEGQDDADSRIGEDDDRSDVGADDRSDVGAEDNRSVKVEDEDEGDRSGMTDATDTSSVYNTPGPLQKTLITKASLASVSSRVSVRSGAGTGASTSSRTPASTKTRSLAPSVKSQTPTASSSRTKTTMSSLASTSSPTSPTASRSPSATGSPRPSSRGSTRSRVTTTTTHTGRSSALPGSSRPSSRVSTRSFSSSVNRPVSTLSSATDRTESTSFKTATSGLSTPVNTRSRRPSAASTLSVRTAGGAGAASAGNSPVNERTRKISGASVSSVASTTGSVRSVAANPRSPTTAKAKTGATPVKRVPSAPVDPDKLSPASAAAKSPRMQTSRSAGSVVSSSAAGEKSPKVVGVMGKKPTPLDRKKSSESLASRRSVAGVAKRVVPPSPSVPPALPSKEVVEDVVMEEPEEERKLEEAVKEEEKENVVPSEAQAQASSPPQPASTLAPPAPATSARPKSIGSDLSAEEQIGNTSSTLTVRPPIRPRPVSGLSSGSVGSAGEHKKSDSAASTSSIATLTDKDRRRGSTATLRTSSVHSGGSGGAPAQASSPALPPAPEVAAAPSPAPSSPPLPPLPSKLPSLPSLPHSPLQQVQQPHLATKQSQHSQLSSIDSLLLNDTPKGATLEIGIPCIISSKRKRFKAYARYIGEVIGETGSWVGVEVPLPVVDSWGDGDGNKSKMDDDRQWNDGSWGGIRYFEIGGGLGGSEWDYGEDRDRASRRRRLDGSFTSLSGGGSNVYGGYGMSKGLLKREGDQLSIGSERMKRMRSVSPAVSDMSGTETRGLFVRPQQVLYVVDAVGSDL
ncbi:hypothetical protein CVT26_003679 [Gymnopilus dilepis]|uniref:BTB domain-containing protein n=1 Tax=Gymnopilus dilepis TaxID=231916 RepID=A0A409WR70_9AGAR|nr:hypothetical protein CVT26_003679 [Gymnopilus dilepis]